tara:strand:+ start:112 stop:357 length:246 start_codon:yes stop_codon:yes gene_type:complete
VKDNKLIAEFMDVNLIEGQLGEYHESWDWLMPVVGKITRDEKYWENEYREYLMDIIPYAIIEDVYDAVVGFIKNCVSLEKE